MDFLLERLHEGVVAGWEEEAEAMIAATGKTRGETIGTVLQEINRRLHPIGGIGMDTRSAVEHAVDGCEADASSAGDILQGSAGHATIPSRGLIIAAAQGKQF